VCDCVLPPGDNPIAVNKYNNTIIMITRLWIHLSSGDGEGQMERPKLQVGDMPSYSRSSYGKTLNINII
jgi:hypothetical protein